jgi:PPP family 3-phenylpropionic acid transporter
VISWQEQGIPKVATGVLWSVGVGAEIIFFWASARWLRKWSPVLMMTVGAAASILRWWLLALAPPLVLLFPLQLLHAFSFGATYLGFLKYAAANAPERYGATVQALNSALSGGLVLAAATYASGLVHDEIGTAGFAIMSLPAGIGLICAWVLSRMHKISP